MSSDLPVEQSAEQVELDRAGNPEGAKPTAVAQTVSAEATPSPLIQKNLKDQIRINGRAYGPGLDYVPENAFEIWGNHLVEE